MRVKEVHYSAPMIVPLFHFRGRSPKKAIVECEGPERQDHGGRIIKPGIRGVECTCRVRKLLPHVKIIMTGSSSGALTVADAFMGSGNAREEVGFGLLFEQIKKVLQYN